MDKGLQNDIDMLKEHINKMCITTNSKKLDDAYELAKKELYVIYIRNGFRIEKEYV